MTLGTLVENTTKQFQLRPRTVHDNSALMIDRATTCCFLEYQVMRLAPRKIQQPLVECLSSIHEARSASEYPSRYNTVATLNKIPTPEVPLRYLISKCLHACQ
ncbi:hypothetical protein ACOSQ4_013492 [Xanthoceras sorbifolium]